MSKTPAQSTMKTSDTTSSQNLSARQHHSCPKSPPCHKHTTKERITAPAQSSVAAQQGRITARINELHCHTVRNSERNTTPSRKRRTDHRKKKRLFDLSHQSL
jgi:hypothetical protein